MAVLLLASCGSFGEGFLELATWEDIAMVETAIWLLLTLAT